MNIHKLHKVKKIRAALAFTASGVLLSTLALTPLINRAPSALASSAESCISAGVFRSATSGPAALTASDITRAEAAMNWLKSMTASKTKVVTNSTIEMSDYYGPSYIDDMYGTFTLSGRTYEKQNGFYVGIEFRQYVIADIAYYIGSAPAYEDDWFMFNSSNKGRKLIQLVDTATNEVLAEYVDKTGLIRSYLYEPGEQGYGTAMEDRSFSYDQSLALFAAIGTQDDEFAKTLVDGMLLTQTQTGQHAGGFVFSAPQLSPSEADPSYRTGSHSITTDALLTYIQKYPNDPNIAEYTSAALLALDFIDKTYAQSGPLEGLYKGGYGAYRGAQQEFDPGYTIEWASTEHNIDIWHTFMRAAIVLDDPAYTTKASSLASAIMSKLYNTSESRINQGISELEVDPSDPLDVNSWGAIQLSGSGSHQAADAALARVSRFENSKKGATGYAPYYSAGGYPGATETVWYEGTFGVALAQYRLGNDLEYRRVIENAAPGQEADGSFRYATNADPIYEIGQSRSVAGTAWYILATTAKDVMWNNCMYSAPVEPTEPVIPVKPSTPAPDPEAESEPGSTPTPTTPTSAPNSSSSSKPRPKPNTPQLATNIFNGDQPAQAVPDSEDEAAGSSNAAHNNGRPVQTPKDDALASPSPDTPVASTEKPNLALPLTIGAAAGLTGLAITVGIVKRRRR